MGGSVARGLHGYDLEAPVVCTTRVPVPWYMGRQQPTYLPLPADKRTATPAAAAPTALPMAKHGFATT